MARVSVKGTHFVRLRGHDVALAAFHIPLSRFWNPVAVVVLLASRLHASFGSLAGRCVSCCGRGCQAHPEGQAGDHDQSIAAAALRLLLFAGCRLREILHLRWEYVDFERGCLSLPDSKSGRKTVILNAPALVVLNGLERVGPFAGYSDGRGKPARLGCHAFVGKRVAAGIGGSST